PDPSLSRDEMEILQRTVAADAEFIDRLPFDPAAVTRSTGPADASESTQSTLTDSHDSPIIAGVDQAFVDDTAISAIVVLRDGEVIERTHAVTELSVPYIPGLLSFREGEAIVEAFGTLDCEPDLACFDGSGRIHYRQAGLATHMGVIFDLPAIGIAKSLLCGDPRESVDDRPAGWRTPIESTDAVDCPAETVIGYAYQSRQYDSGSQSINPLYVSPGHRVSAETAVDLVAALGGGYKLPEPTRLADSYAAEVKSALVDE
ncbi:MAG: endonuclease V, partial [Halohasta sp.]